MMDEGSIKKLEGALAARDAGLGPAIRQMDRIIARLEAKYAAADPALKSVKEEEAEGLGVFSPQEVEIVLEVAQHLGDNQVLYCMVGAWMDGAIYVIDGLQVRTICMGPTDGFARGAAVYDTGTRAHLQRHTRCLGPGINHGRFCLLQAPPSQCLWAPARSAASSTWWASPSTSWAR
jgi:hypothetical protein